MLTPLGCGVEPTWTRLLKGESSAKKIDTFDVSDIACKIACVIPRGDGSTPHTIPTSGWSQEQRKVDEFIVFAMCAARQALDDAGWHPKSYDEQTTTGVVIGSGIGVLRASRKLRSRCMRRALAGCRHFSSRAASSILPPASYRSRSA
jgi:3-oxoacyl-[acyl-carrier-protein] synthase II